MGQETFDIALHSSEVLHAILSSGEKNKLSNLEGFRYVADELHTYSYGFHVGSCLG